jgi:hypothetical protein
MNAPNDNTAPKGSRGVVGISRAIRPATHNLAMGVPPPAHLGGRARWRWPCSGLPWRRCALLRRERPEDVRADDGVPGRGGGTVLVRLLGAGHRPRRSRPSLSLPCSYGPGECGRPPPGARRLALPGVLAGAPAGACCRTSSQSPTAKPTCGIRGLDPVGRRVGAIVWLSYDWFSGRSRP